LTRILILISVGVALISQLGSNWQVLRYFSIADYQISGSMISWKPGLVEVFHGQIWRLVTPIFIHYGIFHILFNMYWLYYLGSQIENIQGIKVYILLVVTIAIIPNVCQFIVSGPGFGGMSGVNYGLLGYIWIREKFDPNSGLHIENYLIVWMMIWFFLGLTGLIGNIANTVHGVGLVVGMMWGYFLAKMSTFK
jgi:GlpG protein